MVRAAPSVDHVGQKARGVVLHIDGYAVRSLDALEESVRKREHRLLSERSGDRDGVVRARERRREAVFVRDPGDTAQGVILESLKYGAPKPVDRPHMTPVANLVERAPHDEP